VGLYGSHVYARGISGFSAGEYYQISLAVQKQSLRRFKKGTPLFNETYRGYGKMFINYLAMAVIREKTT